MRTVPDNSTSIGECEFQRLPASRRRRARRLAAATLTVGLVIGVVTLADVLVSNLGEPERAATAIGNNPNSLPLPPDNKAWYWAAQSFTTDDATYALVSVEAVVGDATDAPAPLAFAELHADDAGSIGALLTTLTVPDLSGPRAARTFLPDAPVQLQPNTTYWFVQGVAVGSDGGYLWGYADTGLFSGPGALSAFAFSADSGGLWTYGTDFPFQVAVNVSTAPLDSDGDGVNDEDDQCPNSAPGAIVDAVGRPKGDFDLDCDVDLDDFAVFQNNFTGPDD